MLSIRFKRKSESVIQALTAERRIVHELADVLV